MSPTLRELETKLAEAADLAERFQRERDTALGQVADARQREGIARWQVANMENTIRQRDAFKYPLPESDRARLRDLESATGTGLIDKLLTALADAEDARNVARTEAERNLCRIRRFLTGADPHPMNGLAVRTWQPAPADLGGWRALLAEADKSAEWVLSETGARIDRAPDFVDATPGGALLMWSGFGTYDDRGRHEGPRVYVNRTLRIPAPPETKP